MPLSESDFYFRERTFERALRVGKFAFARDTLS
jgi:hypothetical protein